MISDICIWFPFFSNKADEEFGNSIICISNLFWVSALGNFGLIYVSNLKVIPEFKILPITELFCISYS